MTNHRSVVADNYKQRAIEIYDIRKAALLHHPRLRVPKYGAMLEFCNFVVLIVVFVLALMHQDKTAMNGFEVVFIVFASAFALAEYTASLEHGWGIYIANMWNVFDTSFVVVFLLYLALRIKGLSTGDVKASELGFDILACGACILFPRLAFFLVKNNVVVLALRGMVTEFLFFMCIAAICFSGLLFTLKTLAPADRWSVKSIAWLMTQIWFGNTYLSFGQAESFHPIFGPILMTGFAALSNTLLLTILISILSNTFARIDANANQEYLFQFTIITLEGMKSDALFSYQPPFNLLAFAILWPASFILSPRSLHSANVFLIRLTSFPILLTISLYERSFQEHPHALPVQSSSSNAHSKSNSNGKGLRHSTQSAAQSLYNSLPKAVKTLPVLEAIMGTHADDVYEAIFEVEGMVGEDEIGLLEDEGEEDGRAEDRVGLRSWASRERFVEEGEEVDGEHGDELDTEPAGTRGSELGITTSRPRSASTGARSRRPSSIPRSPTQASVRPSSSSRPRYLSLRTEAQRTRHVAAGEVHSPVNASPLARLFGVGRRNGGGDGLNANALDVVQVVGERLDKLEERVKSIQSLLEESDIWSQSANSRSKGGEKRKDTTGAGNPKVDVSGLKDEMKELQERQARIESLLMILTRGMRNEVGTTGTPSKT